MLKAGTQGLQIVVTAIDQPETAQDADTRDIQGNGVAAERVLNDPGDGVVVGSLVTAQLLGGLLESFLVEALQVEGKGGFENLLKETDQPVGAVFRVGDVAQRFFDFTR